MAKKGKYKLLSYVVENNLIFYKSLNKVKKYVAFSLFETLNGKFIISLLNKALDYELIDYFSIQIKPNENKKLIILLKFEGINKEEIIRRVKYLYEKLSNESSECLMLTADILERAFLEILVKDIKRPYTIKRKKDLLTLSSEKDSTSLNLFEVDIKKIKNKNTFISNFLKLCVNLERNGYLIFNFKKNTLSQIASIYYVDLTDNTTSSEKFKIEINNFYDCQLLKKCNLDPTKVFLILWRLDISNQLVSGEEVMKLFTIEQQFDFEDLASFYSRLEIKLFENNIKFTKIKEDLLLIEDKSLFYWTDNLTFEILSKMLEKYYSRFNICILILNETDYNQIIELEYAKSLKRLKILNVNDFLSLDLKSFKNVQV